MSLHSTASHKESNGGFSPVQHDARIMSLTHVGRALSAPKTLPERLAARRTELGLSHGYIADRVYVTRYIGTRREKQVKIARNTYCNYERGTIPPKMEVLTQIAAILKVSVQWLLFGENKTTTLERFELNHSTKTFEKKQDWSIDHKWLTARFGANAHNLVVSQLPEDTSCIQTGDMAIIRRDEQPSATPDDYVYMYQGKAHAAKIVRPAASKHLRIYPAGAKTYEEVPMTKVLVLGKIVGKMGGL